MRKPTSKQVLKLAVEIHAVGLAAIRKAERDHDGHDLPFNKIPHRTRVAMKAIAKHVLAKAKGTV